MTEQPLICCLCNKPIPEKHGWKLGNNAEPVAEGRCCDPCDNEIVIPYRIVMMARAARDHGR